MHFAVLAPLVPSLTRELSLSGQQVGMLVGAFSLTLGLTCLPIAVLAARLSLVAVVLVGVAILTAGTILFGVAERYETLLIARMAQGAGGGLCWAAGLAWLVGAAPRHRRGEMIGRFSSGQAAGQLAGAALGGVAIVASRPATFSIAALVTAALGVQARRYPSTAPAFGGSLSRLLRAHRGGHALGGLGLVVLPGLLSGVVFALGPLRLSELDVGHIGITSTFLIAAALGVLARHGVGRWADHVGHLTAIQVLLIAACLATGLLPWLMDELAFSVGLIFTIVLFGAAQGPAMAFLSELYEDAGMPLVVAFGLMGMYLGVGFFVGSAVTGLIAEFATQTAALLLACGICVLGFSLATALASKQAASPAQDPGRHNDDARFETSPDAAGSTSDH